MWEWAVLSACDTGLGTVISREGVLGLRRAFQVAGVRTVIMSLWSVDDRATLEWMQRLYESRFRRNLSTADAMRDASVADHSRAAVEGTQHEPVLLGGVRRLRRLALNRLTRYGCAAGSIFSTAPNVSSVSA